jgi:nitrate/nitrite transporter NarK
MSRRSTMVLFLVAMYFFSYFHRASPAVIAPNLMQDFSLNAESLGLLSSMFFYIFALAQLPLGPALDSIGPRIVLTILGMISAAGSLIFASAHSFDLCLLGRGLVGWGMSGTFMGTMTLVAVWYPPKIFTAMAGWIFAMGNMGSLTATFPLALLAKGIGWRSSFLLLAAITFILALMIWVTVRNHPSDSTSTLIKKQGPFAVKRAYRILLGNISFWKIVILNFFGAGSFLSIQTLWGGPFLMDVFGKTPAGAGSILSSVAIGQIIGGSCVGFLSDRLAPTRKKQIIIWMSIYLIPIILLCTLLRPGRTFLLLPVYLAIGFFGTGGLLNMALLKELFPPQILGTALTLNNFFGMGGVAVLQFLMGLIIGRYPAVNHAYPLQAYRSAFYLLLAGLVASLFFFSRSADFSLSQAPGKRSRRT